MWFTFSFLSFFLYIHRNQTKHGNNSSRPWLKVIVNSKELRYNNHSDIRSYFVIISPDSFSFWLFHWINFHVLNGILSYVSIQNYQKVCLKRNLKWDIPFKTIHFWNFDLALVRRWRISMPTTFIRFYQRGVGEWHTSFLLLPLMSSWSSWLILTSLRTSFNGYIICLQRPSYRPRPYPCNFTCLVLGFSRQERTDFIFW